MKAINISTPNYPNTFTMVDDADFDWLNQWKWHASPEAYTTYARRRLLRSEGKPKNIYMHRVIMKTPVGMVTDHIDRNGLNNQRNNLRVCTTAQNQMNMRARSGASSKFKGVSYSRKDKIYEAHITCAGKYMHLGSYKNEADAAIAYNAAAPKYFGEFARLNNV